VIAFAPCKVGSPLLRKTSYKPHFLLWVAPAYPLAVEFWRSSGSSRIVPPPLVPQLPQPPPSRHSVFSPLCSPTNHPLTLLFWPIRMCAYFSFYIPLPLRFLFSFFSRSIPSLFIRTFSGCLHSPSIPPADIIFLSLLSFLQVHHGSARCFSYRFRLTLLAFPLSDGISSLFFPLTVLSTILLSCQRSCFFSSEKIPSIRITSLPPFLFCKSFWIPHRILILDYTIVFPLLFFPPCCLERCPTDLCSFNSASCVLHKNGPILLSPPLFPTPPPRKLFQIILFPTLPL